MPFAKQVKEHAKAMVLAREMVYVSLQLPTQQEHVVHQLLASAMSWILSKKASFDGEL